MIRCTCLRALPAALVAFATLAAPGLHAAQEGEPTTAPRTIASQLVVDALRESMTATRNQPARDDAPTGVPSTETAPASGLALGARAAWAWASVVRTGRQLAFEAGRMYRAAARGIGPLFGGAGRELATPYGAVGAIVVFSLLVAIPALALRRRRRGPRPDRRPRRTERTREIADARSLIALGTPTTEVSARTGIPQDIVATMRRLA